MRSIRALTMSLALLVSPLAPFEVIAQVAGWQDNLSMLPSYCRAKAQKRPSPHSSLNAIWLHMHHYCSGVYAEKLVRGGIDNKREKKVLLRGVQAQMSYMSNHCRSGCVLYPELHSRWAWALDESGEIAKAISHYKLAIHEKPDYTTAYAGLSDLYKKLNRPDEARKVLEAGLEIKPRSNKLKRRLKQLQ